MEKKQLKIRVHPTQHKDLRILAAKHGKSINFIVEQALREFILKHKGETK